MAETVPGQGELEPRISGPEVRGFPADPDVLSDHIGRLTFRYSKGTPARGSEHE